MVEAPGERPTGPGRDDLEELDVAPSTKKDKMPENPQDPKDQAGAGAAKRGR